ncbi:MAG: hydrogenase expression/formation protein HypE [Clostridiales Family XIII bacterium]|jgi:hydrogenase expression/formation protein HypE|nr:hydrogenase expression/formation protein HypE [Clostridiales Family XIII bacterium]
MKENAKKITQAHGAGGRDSAELMRDVFGKHFSNNILDKLEDGAVLPWNVAARPVVSTDSFVVKPIEFRGGDIGKLSVCGTVNDLLMMGAIPKYLTCGFVLEEGLEIATLERVVASMAATARAAGVLIVAGDTKVIESSAKANEGGGGLLIGASGIGSLRDGATPSASNARPGDAVVVSGNLGDHHACILSARMGIENDIASDCAILRETTDSLLDNGIDVHVMRDVTRGGLGTVLNEIAALSDVTVELSEIDIPVNAGVAAFCGVMGLDPLYMGNEGKMIAIVPKEQAARAVNLMRATDTGRNARVIGEILLPSERDRNLVAMKTKVGGTRRINALFGEGLPRIC